MTVTAHDRGSEVHCPGRCDDLAVPKAACIDSPYCGHEELFDAVALPYVGVVDDGGAPAFAASPFAVRGPARTACRSRPNTPELERGRGGGRGGRDALTKRLVSDHTASKRDPKQVTTLITRRSRLADR